MPDDREQREVEAVAAMIGLHAIPWTLTHRPNVQWPADYAEDEKKKFREAAVDIIAALDRIRAEKR